MSAEITAPWYRLQLDLFTKLVATCMEQAGKTHRDAAWSGGVIS
ncbi:Probably ATP-dependent helicase [Shigella flexneri]|nr:Probably ATP-dependent helicase [Shigella flexneri]